MTLSKMIARVRGINAWNLIAPVSLAAALMLAPQLEAQDAPPPASPPPSTPAPPPAAPAPPTAPAATQPAAPTTQPAVDLPPAREIVEASLVHFGGKDAVEKAKAFQCKALLSGPMGQVEYDLKWGDQDQFWVQQGMADSPKSVLGSDGKITWVLLPDDRGYQLVEDPEVLANTRQQLNMLFPFRLALRPGDQFQVMETLDIAPFGGEDAYRVKMGTGAENEKAQYTFHYAVDDMQIKGVTIKQDSPFGLIEVAFMYEEWKELNDLKLFTKMLVNQPGQAFQMTYSDLQFGAVDPSSLELPEQVKALIQKKMEAPTTAPAAPPPPAPAPATQPDGGAR